MRVSNLYSAGYLVPPEFVSSILRGVAKPGKYYRVFERLAPDGRGIEIIVEPTDRPGLLDPEDYRPKPKPINYKWRTRLALKRNVK